MEATNFQTCHWCYDPCFFGRSCGASCLLQNLIEFGQILESLFHMPCFREISQKKKLGFLNIYIYDIYDIQMCGTQCQYELQHQTWWHLKSGLIRSFRPSKAPDLWYLSVSLGVQRQATIVTRQLEKSKLGCSLTTWLILIQKLLFNASNSLKLESRLDFSKMKIPGKKTVLTLTKQSFRCIVAMIDQLRWNGGHNSIATCHFKLSPKQSKCLMSSSSRTSHRSSMLKWSPSFPKRKWGSKIGKFWGMNFWGPWTTNLWSRLKMGKIRLFQPGKFVVNHDKWDIDHIKAWSTLGLGLPHFETWSLMNSSGTWLLFFDLRRTPLVCKTAHLQMLNLYIYINGLHVRMLYIYMCICIYMNMPFMDENEHGFELAEGTNQVGL
jgi:hypothetical protein